MEGTLYLSKRPRKNYKAYNEIQTILYLKEIEMLKEKFENVVNAVKENPMKSVLIGLGVVAAVVVTVVLIRENQQAMLDVDAAAEATEEILESLPTA